MSDAKTMEKNIIQLKGVTAVYETKCSALTGIDLQVKAGEFCFITGASGSGKTALFKLLSAEHPAAEGTIQVNGYRYQQCRRQQLLQARRAMGLIFQDFRLIDTLTVDENLEIAMRCIGAQTKQIDARIKEVLTLVGLAGKRNSFPTELSGGEQQRVAIARAVINRPVMILADEPTGTLDPLLAKDILDLLVKINRESGTTVVVITHARELVDRFHERVITLSEGRIVSDVRKGKYLDRKAVAKL